jgi:hypothetical protein
MKIRLWGLGRDKASASIEVSEGGDVVLAVLREARKHLGSHGIDVDEPEGGEPGTISVGMGRVVGYWKYARR